MFGQNSINENLISFIQEVLQKHNPFVKMYQQASERIRNAEEIQIVFKDSYSRTENAPTCSEVAVLMSGDGSLL